MLTDVRNQISQMINEGKSLESYYYNQPQNMTKYIIMTILI